MVINFETHVGTGMRAIFAGVFAAGLSLAGTSASAVTFADIQQAGTPDFGANVSVGDTLSYSDATNLFNMVLLSNLSLELADTSAGGTNLSGPNEPVRTIGGGGLTNNPEIRASAFITPAAALGPVGTLHDGSTGRGVLTITGEFSYDDDTDDIETLFSGPTVSSTSATQLIYATIEDVRVPQTGDNDGDDIRMLWRIDSSLSVASSLFGRFIETKINSGFLDQTNPFGAPGGFNVTFGGFVDNRYAEIPLPGALPLFAAGLGALGLARLRRRAA